MSISLEWLGFTGITLSVLAYLPQIIHLVKERCSAGLAPKAYCIWVISSVLLLAYAVTNNDPVFVLLQCYQVAASSLILYYSVRYKDQVCGECDVEASAVKLPQRKPLLGLFGNWLLARFGNDGEAFRNDPLSHPDLMNMSLDQLADLQFHGTRNSEKS